MSNFALPIPDAPSRIDPEVLSKINALFKELEMMKTPNSPKQTGVTKKREAWWENTEPPSADQQVSENMANGEENKDGGPKAVEEDELELNQEQLLLPPCEDDIEVSIQSSEVNAFLSPESTTTAQLAPQPIEPIIIARYIYPAERRPGTNPQLPVRPARPAPPTLASLIRMIFQCILELFTDFFTDEPAIIEYTPRQIRQRVEEIRVEAQVVEHDVSAPINSETTTPERVVGILALIHVGQDVQRQATPITATPKRVRQLLKGHGVDLVEDVYGNQIKAALKDLGIFETLRIWDYAGVVA
jgi:hypothetical protein